jgi:hypothetical protein
MLLYLQMLFPYAQRAFIFAKRAFIVLVTFFIAIQLFSYFANQNKVNLFKGEAESKAKIYKTINDPTLNSTEEGRNYVAMFSTIMCGIAGEGCDKHQFSEKNGVHNTLIGSISSIVVMPLQNMPASGVMWAHDGLQNAGLISRSYATEGVGFAALQPFRGLWSLFRNLVFFLLILVMIAIGFMIMFRTKINAQTVISVENALPKIVLSMILITFSYAIAGFLIDTMYVVMGIIFALFKTTNISPGLPELQQQALFGGQESLWGTIISGGDNNVWTVANTFYHFIPDELQSVLDGFVTSYLIGVALIGISKLPGKFIHGLSGNKALTSLATAGKWMSPIFSLLDGAKPGNGTPIVGLVISVFLTLAVNFLGATLFGPFFVTAIITLLLYLSLIFIFFRIFFMFLSAFIQIMLMVIFAPALLVLEAIPGKSIFGTWFKGIAFNLATFPMFLLLLLVSRVIMATDATGTMEASLWTPPFIANVAPQAFKTLVAGLLLFSSPELIKGFKQMLGYKPLPLAVNFGSFFGGITALGGGVFGLANQYHSLKGTLFGQPVGEGLLGSNEGKAKGGPQGKGFLGRMAAGLMRW